MSDRQSAIARERWRSMSPDERRSRTSAAIAASGQRRRVANALLRAVEAAGLKVDLVDDGSEGDQ